MISNWKKVLAVALSIIMLLALSAGCSQQAAPEASQSETQEPGKKAEAEKTEAEKPASNDPMDFSNAKIDWKQKEGTKLRAMFNKHFFTDGLQARLSEYEDLTGIKVQFETYPEGDYYNKLLIELNGGSNPPDVFMIDYATAIQYNEGGWLEPLKPYIDNPQLTDNAWYEFEDFMPSAVELGVVDGKMYGLPVTGEWEILFYRKDLYEKYNLSVPETFDELYENVKKLHSDEVSGYVARCARGSALFWPWGGFVRTYGGYWVDSDRKPQLTSEPTMKATEMYAKLLKDGGPKGVVNYTWYEALTDFQQGKAAHFIDSSGFMASVEDPEKSVVAGKVGYALLPSAEKGKNSVPCLAHWMVAMNSQSKNKEGAYLFLQWATSKKVALDIAINNGTAARSSLWENKEFLAKYPEQWATVSLESSKNASKSCLNLLKEVWELGEALEIAVNEMYGGKTTEAAMKDAQAKSVEILSK